MNRKGFTLVEIMIVVAIVGILSAIAIPAFARARTTAEKNACIANLKQIQSAVEVWALDTNTATSATPATSDIVPAYLRTWPKCKNAPYAVPAVLGTPVCPNSLAGHTIGPSGGGDDGGHPPQPSPFF